MIDFTNYEIDILSNYGGSDQKRGIIYQNKKYMLKMSDRILSEKRNELNSSYSNSTFSEYICCHILETMNIPVQKTLLGFINSVSRHGEKKQTPVVACENFIPTGYELIEFKNIENALLYNKPGKIPKIQDIYDIFLKENIYFDKEFGKQALQRYWDTFVLDAFLGNFDRHANNWGYLINKETKSISLAPIYDCGSCLFPQIADDAIKSILSSEDEINKRVFVFPTAALELENGKKANYYDFISSLQNNDCNNALRRIFPLINLKEIFQFIDDMDEISDIRKQFYRVILTNRHEKILEYSYNKLPDLSIQNKEDFELEL